MWLGSSNTAWLWLRIVREMVSTKRASSCKAAEKRLMGEFAHVFQKSSSAAETPLGNMDLTVIQQQVVFSSASVRGKAEALLLERSVYELSREEWRELIAGVPADVKRQIGMLKSAGTQGHLFVSLSSSRHDFSRFGKTLPVWSVA